MNTPPTRSPTTFLARAGDPSPRPQSGSLSQQAYEAIKGQIVSLRLPPGAVIDESRLQGELDLGRTPIREALQRLAQEKLVAVIPRRGTFVTGIELKDLKLLFEARLPMEALAARLAAQRGNDEHWRQMEAALNRLPANGAPHTNEDLIAIDAACHEIMYEAIGNPFLRDTLVTLYALSLRLWYYSLSHIGDVGNAIQEHRAILDALRQREGDRAAQIMEQHIRAFQTEIQAAMVGEPGPAS
jgi:DNA-binding GntR family transcriptional regulator